MMSDWVQSIFIVVMFSMFLMVDAFNGGVRSVQENWNMYRCNPVMMPFAGQFAPKGSTLSTQDNFSYCVQNMMSNFAPAFTQPFAHLQNMTVDMMGSINDSTGASLSQSSWFSFSVTNIFKNVYNVFLNIVVEFTILTNKLLDAQGKISAIITTLLYIVTAVQYTFESMWNGIPGKMIQTIGKL